MSRDDLVLLGEECSLLASFLSLFSNWWIKWAKIDLADAKKMWLKQKKPIKIVIIILYIQK